MHLPRASKNEQGFTLVELLVVIGIIAILTAIAVPMFLSQRKKANDASLRSDLKNTALVVETAMVKYEDMEGIKAALGGYTGSTIFLNKDSGVKTTFPTISRFWNDSGLLPVSTYDPRVNIEIVHMSTPSPTSRWAKSASAHDYCLFGSHFNGGKYNFKQGDTNADYDKALYYDSRLGGIVEAKDIAAAISGKTDEQAAQISSCHGYGFRYAIAAGL